MTNKQMNLLRDVIMDRVKEEQESIKEENNFTQRVFEGIENHPIQQFIEDIKELDKEISSLREQRKGFIEDIKDYFKKHSHKEHFLINNPRISDINSWIEDEVKEDVSKEIGIKTISYWDIEKQVLLNQDKDLEELIDAVLESLKPVE